MWIRETDLEFKTDSGSESEEVPEVPVHCKKIWVTSNIFWSSQLHACYVRDKLQNFKTMLPI